MRNLTICLLLASAAAPAAAQDAVTGQPESPPVITIEVPENIDEVQEADEAHESHEPDDSTEVEDEAEEDEEFDMAKMMAAFDKIFPAQPDPDPARLALARTTAAGVLPDGTYAAVFEELMGGMVDRVLSLSPADFGELEDGEEAANMSLREAIAKDDPHFEERMRIMRDVIGEELVKITALVEPKLRDGLARSIARRFDEAQLRDINAFLATDSGKAFGSQTMRMWMDPDVMRSMMQSLPEMMMAVPSAMKRVEAATAHLPPPPKKDDKEEAAEGESEKEASDVEADAEAEAEAAVPAA